MCVCVPIRIFNIIFPTKKTENPSPEFPSRLWIGSPTWTGVTRPFCMRTVLEVQLRIGALGLINWLDGWMWKNITAERPDSIQKNMRWINNYIIYICLCHCYWFTDWMVLQWPAEAQSSWIVVNLHQLSCTNRLGFSLLPSLSSRGFTHTIPSYLRIRQEKKSPPPPKKKKKLSSRPLLQHWQPFFLSSSKLWWLSPRYWAHKFHCDQGLGCSDSLPGIIVAGSPRCTVGVSELPNGPSIQSISPVSIERGTCHWRIRTQWGWPHPHL